MNSVNYKHNNVHSENDFQEKMHLLNPEDDDVDTFLEECEREAEESDGDYATQEELDALENDMFPDGVDDDNYPDLSDSD